MTEHDVPDPGDEAAARRSFTAEQRLVAGVIGRAITDLSISTGPDAKAAATAATWIWGDDCGGEGFSFVAACEHVGLDPDAVRRLAAEADGRRIVVRREHVCAQMHGTVPRVVRTQDEPADAAVGRAA
jgi:hypothetical protein